MYHRMDTRERKGACVKLSRVHSGAQRVNTTRQGGQSRDREVAQTHEGREDASGWIAPKNVSEVKYFMGIVGYYRRFIAGFSKIAHPITSLQNNGIKFEWTIECENNFNLLK
jgi:hypothetical protein